MTNHPIKLTTLTIAILSSFNASAALYRVVEVAPPSSITYGTDYKSSFGVSIQQSSGTNCFTTGCGDSTYLLSGETRYQDIMAGQPIDGYDLKEEVPFGIDNEFVYDTEAEFQSYCSVYLGYNTCSYWGTARWNEKAREDSGSVTSYAFTQDTGSTASSFAFSSLSSTSNNKVITGSDTSGDAVGFTLSTTDERTTITPSTDIKTYTKARQWKTKAFSDYPDDGSDAEDTSASKVSTSISVGSVSTTYSDHFVSNAALWIDSSAAAYTIDWGSAATSTDETRNSRYAQGSIRDVWVDTDNNVIYAVGYNGYGDYYYMSATLFKISYSVLSDISTWSSTPTVSTISNAVITSSDSEFTNTKLTGINSNKIAIGESKLDSSHAENGAYSNKLFVADVSASTPTATYFSTGTGNIGFSGAGGHVNAINNYNDIVGQIDTESSREVDGKPRRKRGFIYPYNDSTNGSIFGSQAWLLDDLTNGGTYSSANNAYRILSANDINDAGVIAASAIKCSGGYSATTHDASCSGTETTVAVQLIPIQNATSSDISARGYESTSTSRSGGSLGLFGLIPLFGMLMLRRRK